MRRSRAFMDAAEIVEGTLDGDEDAEAELAAALVTLWVHAGIAASDVICCVRLGKHHKGEDHRAAKALLRRADKGQEGPLGVLLGLKTPSRYGHRLVSREDRVRAKRAAETLIRPSRRDPHLRNSVEGLFRVSPPGCRRPFYGICDDMRRAPWLRVVLVQFVPVRVGKGTVS